MSAIRYDRTLRYARGAAAERGFSQDDIKEIILQQAIYCGVPAANRAFKEAAAVIEEVGKSK